MGKSKAGSKAKRKSRQQGGAMSDEVKDNVTNDVPIKGSSPKDAILELYGSSDGWLSLRFDDKSEIYLVPRGVYEQAKKRITQTMVPNTWVHLGEYAMVEP